MSPEQPETQILPRDTETASCPAREDCTCFVLDRGLRGVMFWEYTSDCAGKLLETTASGLGVKPAPKPPMPEAPEPRDSRPPDIGARKAA